MNDMYGGCLQTIEEKDQGHLRTASEAANTAHFSWRSTFDIEGCVIHRWKEHRLVSCYDC